MQRNPYPEEPKNAQPTEVMPRGERMPDMPAKPPAQAPSPPPMPAAGPSPEVEDLETRQEEAHAVRYAIGKLNDFLRWFVAVLEIMLALRFLLKAIGAVSTNLFAAFLYTLTDIVLFPFSGILNPTVLKAPYQSFEWATLIAMIVYALLFWGLRRFLSLLITRPEEPVP
ncbi:MAG: YggT family protein [Ktedonobacteraceae bacterium]|nr:YggT family protein [Ktedonobacteraceae bacterium]